MTSTKFEFRVLLKVFPKLYMAETYLGGPKD